MDKKLYRSLKNRQICGVCGGLAEYFNVDATVIRFVWAVLIICGGSGLLAYIAAALIIPDEPRDWSM